MLALSWVRPASEIGPELILRLATTDSLFSSHHHPIRDCVKILTQILIKALSLLLDNSTNFSDGHKAIAMTIMKEIEKVGTAEPKVDEGTFDDKTDKKDIERKEASLVKM